MDKVFRLVKALAIAELAYYLVGLAVLLVAPAGAAQIAGAIAWAVVFFRS